MGSDSGWTRLGSRRIFEHPVIRVREDRWRSKRSGVEHDFVIIESNDWVNIVPVTPEGEMLLVRQHRFGIDAASLEFPGGLVDDGESPAEAARRELLEETGYAAEQLRLLGTIHPNPALHPNVTHTYLALGCRRVADPSLDPAEELELVRVPAHETEDLLRRGEITHSLVAVAFLHWKLAGSPGLVR